MLESATGAVVYRADGDPDIVGPDLHTPLLRRTVPDAEPRLLIRDLSTGTEHPLATACSVAPAVTPRSVLSACFDWVEGAPLRATVGVHSRPNGAPTASITVTDAVRGIPPSTIPPLVELVPAPGAIVLAVQNQPNKQPSTVVGLT